MELNISGNNSQQNNNDNTVLDKNVTDSTPKIQPQQSTARALDGNVVIADTNAPLVILFGPNSCGKSMTLIRLTQYLQSKGRYSITPDRAFRGSSDDLYLKGCDDFPKFVNNPTAVVPEGTTDYMLVDVFDNTSGRVVCKILEAPGEYYFDPSNPNKEYPHYMNTIINAPNRKVWCVMTQPTAEIESLYVSRVRQLKPRLRPGKDQVVIIFHKVDMKPNMIISPGEVRIKEVIKYVDDFYPGLFNIFLNPIPLVNIFKKYDCKLVPFSVGDFSHRNGKLTYQPGVDEFPEKLWKTICKSI